MLLKTPGVHEEASLFLLGTQAKSLYIPSTLSSNASAAFHHYEENMPQQRKCHNSKSNATHTHTHTHTKLNKTISRMTAGKQYKAENFQMIFPGQITHLKILSQYMYIPLVF